VPPDSPSAPTVLGSNRTSVSIRWDVPEADGGSAVTSYEVELRPKSKAGLAGMTDEWLTVYQVDCNLPHALGCPASGHQSLLQHDLFMQAGNGRVHCAHARQPMTVFMSHAAECYVASDPAYGLHHTCALCCSD